MFNIYDFIKKYWAIMVIFIVPISSLFWLPNGSSLLHGLFYPWPENFSAMLNIATQYLYLWIFGGLGLPNTEPSGFLFYFIISLFLKIGGTPHIGQTLFFYFGFAATLGGMYFLARTLNFSRISSIIASIFYLFSPFIFTGMPLEATNFRLITYHIITPILLAIFIRALKTKSFKKELALFGMVCLLASAGYGSLQYSFLNILLLIIYSFFTILMAYKDKKELKSILFRLILLFLIMFLINYYWLNPLLFNFQGAYNLRSEPGFSINHDNNMVAGTSSKIVDALRMIPYPTQRFASPWMSYYYEPLLVILVFIFLAFIPLSLFDKKTRKLALFPVIWFIISIFLVKGVNEPFTFAGKAIFFLHPYFTRLFRNVTYFELIVVPALSLLIGLSIGSFIKRINSKFLMWVSIIMVTVALAVWGWPFISGVPLKPTDNAKPSQYNIIPEYFKETTEFLRNKKEQNRINSIPEFTFQDAFVAYQWDFIYHGIPPLGLLSGKPFYRPLYPQLVGRVDFILDNVLHPQKNTISKEEFNFLSATANVRYITFHKDMAWTFIHSIDPVKFSNFNAEDIENFLSDNEAIKKIKTFGKIDIYRFSNDYFIPQFYTPKSLFILKESLNDFSKIFSLSNYQIRSAIYSENQYNSNVQIKNLVDRQNSNIKPEKDWMKSPVLEFKKINPIKYKVVIHGASNIFPLVSSESFHEGWKVYLTKSGIESYKIKNWNINNYKILDENSDEQANKEELKKYIDNGWITNLESDNIKFVSKNLNGTIQNNNLSNGNFYETWFKDPLVDEKDHVITNIYANSWIINPIQICQNNNQCIQNPDGSHDFELIVEFWPQRLFYVGLGISGITLFCCLGYLVWDWRRETKVHKVHKVKSP